MKIYKKKLNLIHDLNYFKYYNKGRKYFHKKKLPWGSVFHAMVSVTAVNIQFNSPKGVLLSFNWPGIL